MDHCKGSGEPDAGGGRDGPKKKKAKVAAAMPGTSSYKAFEDAMKNKGGGTVRTALDALLNLLRNPNPAEEGVSNDFIVQANQVSTPACFTMHDLLITVEGNDFQLIELMQAYFQEDPGRFWKTTRKTTLPRVVYNLPEYSTKGEIITTFRLVECRATATTNNEKRIYLLEEDTAGNELNLVEIAFTQYDEYDDDDCIWTFMLDSTEFGAAVWTIIGLAVGI
tara:strand:- start:67 stop:732 length:666 start_codon:yes stop_codon:yes gene_type:complete